MKAVSIIVDGIVQGVGYRWFTVDAAVKFGLSGWVRNRSRGDVEVYVEGEEGAIDKFITELRRGPRYGQVDGLDIEVREYTGEFADFRIKH